MTIFNFRSTSGYVTDGAGETYILSEAYPVTRGGETFGYDSVSGLNVRDRSTSIGSRFAGEHFYINNTAERRIFIVDTGNGTFDVNIAAGPYGATASTYMDIVGLDSSNVVQSVLATVSNGEISTAGQVLDAQGTEFANQAAWEAGEQSVQVSLSGSSVRLGIRYGAGTGAGTYYTHIRSVGIEAVADTTAPILSSPTGTASSDTTASGTVSTDEGNGILYYYASINSSETAATIKASGSNQAVSSTGVQNVTFTGLTASTTYYAHYVHEDASNNQSNVVSSASFTTYAPVVSITPSTTTPTQGDVVTITVDNGVGPYTATFNGDSLTIDSQNATSITLTWPDIKTFGGQDASYEVALPLVVTDTDDAETDSVDMTTQVETGYEYETIAATTGIFADDVGVAIGDRAYGFWLVGTGSADLTVGALSSPGGGTFRYWIQDDTDSMWGTYADEVIIGSGGDVIPPASRVSVFHIANALRAAATYTHTQTNEIVVEWLESEGISRSALNQMLYGYLGGLGYTGTLQDRMIKWSRDV